jgi:hypothetical protein
MIDDVEDGPKGKEGKEVGVIFASQGRVSAWLGFPDAPPSEWAEERGRGGEREQGET